MIDIQKLSYNYGRRGALVFSDFSLHLDEGCVYGLLAPNGVGKSTLLCLIMGGLLPDKAKGGCVLVDGQPSASRTHDVLRRLYLLPEEVALPSVKFDTYVRTRDPFYKDFSREVLDDCLCEFGLPQNPDIASLSMGQRKKVAICFALATQTKYLLMDEPTNGLDIEGKGQFRRLMARHIGDGQTVVISTHLLADVATLLDHVVLLGRSADNGPARLLLDSSLTDIAAQYTFTLLPSDCVSDSDVLYSERSADGLRAILRRHADDEESPVDLELLYKYLVLSTANNNISTTNYTNCHADKNSFNSFNS